MGVGSGFILNKLHGPEWSATTNVLVLDSPGSVLTLLLTGQSQTVTAEDVADAASMAVSQGVLTQVAQRLNDGEDWTELANHVSAATVPSSHLLTITATAADSVEALRISGLVATTLADVAQQQLSFAVANLPTTGTTTTGTDLHQRGQLLVKTLQPMQSFSTSLPLQTAPSSQTPVALGIVGLAAGALAILALTIIRPSVRRPRDAQRLVGIPAVVFNREDGSADASRLIRALTDLNPRRPLMICPVDINAEGVALEIADWMRQQLDSHFTTHLELMSTVGASTRRLRPADASTRVLVSSTPAATVIGPRPSPSDLAGIVVVVPQGTSRQVLADAVSLLGTWHPVDAVVIAT